MIPVLVKGLQLDVFTFFKGFPPPPPPRKNGGRNIIYIIKLLSCHGLWKKTPRDSLPPAL